MMSEGATAGAGLAAATLVHTARAVAYLAHRGQQDKAGPIAAAAQIFSPDVVAAAWLHDVHPT